MQLPCVIIRDIIFLPGFLLNLVCLRLKFKPLNPERSEGFKGLNFNRKQTKLSKNHSKNIISQIIHKAVAYIILFLFERINQKNSGFKCLNFNLKQTKLSKNPYVCL